MFINEDFLHYVWKFRLFERADLKTTAGDRLEISSVGMQNHNAGPDFSNARIQIADTTWAGNVEVHIKSSDWHRHHHTNDGAYRNVILHVVYKDDEPLNAPDGRPIPTLVLNDRIPPDLFERYQRLMYGEKQFIPCEKSIHRVDDLTLKNWLTRVVVERLEKRSENVIQTLDRNRGDWDETFYQFLAANFGFKVNALPFELLARSIPQIILAKHKNNPLQIEALLFGQSGFLDEDFTDEYPQKLKAEYQFLKHKHNLQPIEKHLWKFMRMRPQNFPTIRLAQFAALITESNHLFAKVLDIKHTDDLRKLFNRLTVNEYWETHYRFDTPSKPAAKSLGTSSIDVLLLNTFVLFLFSYGMYTKQQYFISRAMKLLESLPAESNSIIDGFTAIGVKTKSAFESQALLELKNNYCDHKKCLNCGVGIKILKSA